MTHFQSNLTPIPRLILLIFLITFITSCSTPNQTPKPTPPTSPPTAQPPSNPAPAATLTNTSEPPPGNPDDEIGLAQVMAQQHRTEDALLHYHEAVRLYREQLRRQPDSPETLNHLAWLLAANPNAEIRDGKDALNLAHRACDLTKDQKSAFEITLAAAYAESGQFSEAIKTIRLAHKLALAASDKSLTAQSNELLKLFQSHQSYHEPF